MVEFVTDLSKIVHYHCHKNQTPFFIKINKVQLTYRFEITTYILAIDYNSQEQ